MKNKRHHYLIKKDHKLLEQRAKLTRIANRLIGLPQINIKRKKTNDQSRQKPYSNYSNRNKKRPQP